MTVSVDHKGMFGHATFNMTPAAKQEQARFHSPADKLLPPSLQRDSSQEQPWLSGAALAIWSSIGLVTYYMYKLLLNMILMSELALFSSLHDDIYIQVLEALHSRDQWSSE